MVLKAFLKIDALSTELAEIGMIRKEVELSASSGTDWTLQSQFDKSIDAIFHSLVVDEDVLAVSRDLFDAGFYGQAVEESCKALDKIVLLKSGRSSGSGTSLMESVFSPTKPALQFSDLSTRSKQDQQQGYQRILAGIMLGVRNPLAHEHNWIDDPNEAMECILFIQHLVSKVKSSFPPPRQPASA